jgi:hypothetical protein
MVWSSGALVKSVVFLPNNEPQRVHTTGPSSRAVLATVYCQFQEKERLENGRIHTGGSNASFTSALSQSVMLVLLRMVMLVAVV